MEVRAVSRYTGVSPQKTRLVLDEMRGKRAEEALALLQFMPQQGARIVYKTVKSALANAVENYGYDAADMVITKIYADQAPIRRWRRFGARGRFKPWRRPSSHVTVILEERIAPAPAAKGGSKPSSAKQASKRSGKGAAKPAADAAPALQAAPQVEESVAPEAAAPVVSDVQAEAQAVEAGVVETGVVETGVVEAPAPDADLPADDAAAAAAQSSEE